jgi:hypothetical protein
MRCELVVVVALAGCEYETPERDVVINDDIAGSQLDEVIVLMSSLPSSQWGGEGRGRTIGPLTPGQLARGISVPPTADLWSLDFHQRLLYLEHPDPSATYPSYPVTDIFASSMLFMAIGRRVDETGQLRAVAGGQVAVKNDELMPGVVERDISLSAVDIEEWGLFAPEYEKCKRYQVGTTLIYVVHTSDVDCDGAFYEEDCRPDDYCDPSATSGPLADNCVCP